MTSRKLVYQTLEFDRPERIPRQMWTLPWADMHYPEMMNKIHTEFPDDIVNPPIKLKEPLKTVGESCKIGTYIDEWGCIFENKQNGIIGEVKEPLVTEDDWSDFDDKVHIPQEHLTFDRDLVNQFCRSTDRFVQGFCVRPFEQLQFIRGTENLYMDLAMDPQILEKPLAKIHAFYCEILEEWAKTEIDCLYYMDDWGSQNSLLINPKTWEEIFKPLYKDYIEIAHRHGKKIFMHSDGYTLAILPHLIELGLDAINTQLFCIGLDNLTEFAGKITFWGEIDRQNLLPYGTQEDVKNAVWKVAETLYRDGGVIAQCEFGPGAKPENVYQVFQTWNDVGEHFQKIKA